MQFSRVAIKQNDLQSAHIVHTPAIYNSDECVNYEAHRFIIYDLVDWRICAAANKCQTGNRMAIIRLVRRKTAYCRIKLNAKCTACGSIYICSAISPMACGNSTVCLHICTWLYFNFAGAVCFFLLFSLTRHSTRFGFKLNVKHAANWNI